MDFVKRSQEVFQTEISELAKLKNTIGTEMSQLVRLILQSKGKVVFTGIGKTGLIGRKISSTLTSTGTPSVFMNAAEALHGDLGIIGYDDVLIAISNSGSSQEILNVIEPIKKIGCTLVAMTGDVNSELAKKADIVINIGVEQEASNLNFVPMCSTTAALVMGDALAVCLLESRGFKSDDFEKTHPGGALGKKLSARVKDCMYQQVPKVQQTTLFKDIIYEVSNMRQGITMVYKDNVAIGIITDGDIRRAVQKYDDVKSLTAADIMTFGFKSILPDTKISEAFRMMNENKITSLAVVESDKNNAEIIGVLHIHNIIDFK
ncbi:MAG: KpsF/GutQ family sugar-phosphate isomerase [Paludibacteraceae bacterium]|nr:KpsF/GutQ family sugar-phosphate isomerase [Paludibacteraceae bacterium]